MKKAKVKEKILNQPLYWVESVNGFLYDAIVSYMETHNLNRVRLAEHLGISKGRVSQILNDGEINFSLEKIIEIALKVGKFPVFEFQDKHAYLQEALEKQNVRKMVMKYDNNTYTTLHHSEEDKKDAKLIALNTSIEENHLLAL